MVILTKFLHSSPDWGQRVKNTRICNRGTLQGAAAREPLPGSLQSSSFFWVAVKELDLSYHNPKTILFTIYPSYGNLNPLTATQFWVWHGFLLRTFITPLDGPGDCSLEALTSGTSDAAAGAPPSWSPLQASESSCTGV